MVFVRQRREPETFEEQLAINTAERLSCDVEMLCESKLLDARRMPEFIEQASEERSSGNRQHPPT
jgi:hypothetical protein